LRDYLSKLVEAVPHLENKPLSFQEAFYHVFGPGLRDEADVYILVKELCNLKWEKVNNGKIICKKHIYLLRGDKTPSLGDDKNKHHWPPGSRGGKETIEIPQDFHEKWHVIFLNLYKEKEIDIFLSKLFTDETIDDFREIYELIKNVRKEAKRARY